MLSRFVEALSFGLTAHQQNICKVRAGATNARARHRCNNHERHCSDADRKHKPKQRRHSVDSLDASVHAFAAGFMAVHVAERLRQALQIYRKASYQPAASL